MAIKLKSYSSYLKSVSALVGVPSDRITTEIAEVLRIGFNSGMDQVWNFFNWLDICPYGEARFVGNKLTYCNDLAKTVAWTPTALTITGNSIANPLDGRITASKLMETAATDLHMAEHTAVDIIPSTTYTVSAYIRPNGRSWAFLVFDSTGGSGYPEAFFNVTTGVLGTATNCTSNMQNVGNGFYLCSITFTTSTSITTTGEFRVLTSTNGSTISFAGDTTKGLYVWGCLVQQTTNTSINDSLVDYEQTGEDRIDTPFQVWQDSPFNTTYPRAIGYELKSNGIQIVGTNTIAYATVNSAGVTITTPQSNPVFIWYRKSMPNWEGDTYDATATYAVDDQVYFTDSDSVSNYYKCIAAAAAGDTPETDPDKWELLEIPDALFWPTVWFAFSDWLVSDGQADKAAGASAQAQRKLDDQCEKESRQMARDFPLRVSTHVTSQPRAASY